MEAYETHLALGIALAVGLLVGMEREQARPEHGHAGFFGGSRTYPMFALTGAISTMLAPAIPWLPLVALAGIFALVGISYAGDIKAERDFGLTTEISAIATFLLGALAAARGVVEPVQSRMILVAALGVLLTFLLSSKQWFHGLASRISRDDFFAAVKFLIVAVIVLPLLPDVDTGPLDAINPRNLGILVVTLAALSFAGYVGVHWLGTKRGLLLSAALGGLVSSTAVTLSFAGRAKETPAVAPVAAGAIAIAWTIMLARIAVLVAVVDVALLGAVAVPLTAMAVATLIGLLLTFRRTDGDDAKLELKNPFELGSAIKISLMFGVVLLVTKAAVEYLGPKGLYLASAISGTTDVDAVTVSTARLARGGLDAEVATIAIVLAVVANTIVKTGMATYVGGRSLGRRIAITGGLVLVAGAGGLIPALLS